MSDGYNTKFVALLLPLGGGVLMSCGLYLVKKLYIDQQIKWRQQVEAAGGINAVRAAVAGGGAAAAAAPRPEPLYHNAIWFIAMVCYLLGQVMLVVPEEAKIFPNSTAIGDITALIVAFVFAKWALKEAVSVGDLIAYVFLGVGAILSLFEVEEVLVTFGVFMLYTFLVLMLVCASLGVVWWLHKKMGAGGLGDATSTRARKVLPVAYASLSAMLTAFISVPVTIFLVFYEENGVAFTFVYVIGFLCVMSAELYVLHLALRDFDLLYIAAIFHLSLRLVEFLTTLIFGGFGGNEGGEVITHVVMPLFGIPIMIVAAYVLSRRENFSAFAYHQGGMDTIAPPRLPGNGDSDSEDMDDARPLGRRSRSSSSGVGGDGEVAAARGAGSRTGSRPGSARLDDKNTTDDRLARHWDDGDDGASGDGDNDGPAVVAATVATGDASTVVGGRI